MLSVVLKSLLFKICVLICFVSLHSFRFIAHQKLKSTIFVNKADNILVEQDLSLEYQLTNLFGRLAEHKALGFTSTYNSYTPSALSLWIPTRWSRRLRSYLILLKNVNVFYTIILNLFPTIVS